MQNPIQPDLPRPEQADVAPPEVEAEEQAAHRILIKQLRVEVVVVLDRHELKYGVGQEGIEVPAPNLRSEEEKRQIHVDYVQNRVQTVQNDR